MLEISELIKPKIAEYLRDTVGMLEGKIHSPKTNELRALSYFSSNFDFDPMTSGEGYI
jgi:hypothetical protein